MINIGSVWDRTTDVIIENLSAIVPIALAGVFVPLCLWTSLAPLANGTAPGQRAAIYAGLVLLALWSLAGKLAITALALEPPAGWGGATRIATARLPAAVVVSLVLGVALIVLGLPVVIALGLAGYDFQGAIAGRHPSVPIGGGLVFILFYSLAVLAFLVAIWPRLALVTPAIVAERRSLGAIPRSVRLTHGVAMKILGLLLLYVVVVQVAVLAGKFVFGSLLRLAFGDSGGVSLASVLTAILIAAISTGFAVLAATFTAKLYLAIRGVREGVGAPR